MKRKLFSASKLVLAATSAALAGSFALAGTASAYQGDSAGSAVHGYGATSGSAHKVVSDYKQASLVTDQNVGDCTMFHGASWTFYPNGTMDYVGTVTSSDDNDAWLMRIHVRNAAGVELGLVTNASPQSSDVTSFGKGLPDHNSQYQWVAHGTYPAAWYSQMASIQRDNRC
jgi:hypothetical protein